MTETIKYKRRTFAVVAAEAYAKGLSDGHSAGRKSLERDMDLLLSRNYLLHARLSEGLWSRLTGLFRNRDDRLA